ncbi:uncharacterized protein N7483_012738 [Penicillium malachiteum]|uniref:uncharacterized protein n=1 Tax=Penicillium malachiteum TaxID=1324776 RepID=UPI0025465851|nr:uncharacterized protein N7483_012738 [Penicillium malachiteum]KAJ5715557.1 hypothetical protein N7483_012738 [Penicillium malachiteum]
MILQCLASRKLSSAKQFLYPLKELPPRDVAEDTLAGLFQAFKGESFVKEWADKGFGNVVWSDIQSGASKKKEFASPLSCSHIYLNDPFPRERKPATVEANERPPLFGIPPFRIRNRRLRLNKLKTLEW